MRKLNAILSFYFIIYRLMITKDQLKKKFKNQKDEVLHLLKISKWKWVTCSDFAIKYGILRYWASIFQLRKEWHEIWLSEKYVKVWKRMQRQTKYILIF